MKLVNEFAIKRHVPSYYRNLLSTLSNGDHDDYVQFTNAIKFNPSYFAGIISKQVTRLLKCKCLYVHKIKFTVCLYEGN